MLEVGPGEDIECLLGIAGPAAVLGVAAMLSAPPPWDEPLAEQGRGAPHCPGGESSPPFQRPVVHSSDWLSHRDLSGDLLQL